MENPYSELVPQASKTPDPLRLDLPRDTPRPRLRCKLLLKVVWLYTVTPPHLMTIEARANNMRGRNLTLTPPHLMTIEARANNASKPERIIRKRNLHPKEVIRYRLWLSE